jgi:uncharacterized membrane protein YkgB
MNSLMTFLGKLGVLKKDLDYQLLRASMVVIFLFFGYQKWFQYEAQALIPYISHGPLIFWMYPVFGVRGATCFLGVSEWLFGALLFAGFWKQKARNPWGLGRMRQLHRDVNYYSVHVGRLGGSCWRIPCND